MSLSEHAGCNNFCLIGDLLSRCARKTLLAQMARTLFLSLQVATRNVRTSLIRDQIRSLAKRKVFSGSPCRNDLKPVARDEREVHLTEHLVGSRAQRQRTKRQWDAWQRTLNELGVRADVSPGLYRQIGLVHPKSAWLKAR